MKYYILVLLFTFSTIICTKFKCDKEDACQVCQFTIYKLKFAKQAKCGYSRCKDTCHKVSQEWSQPNSQFEPFLKDFAGKCDACFRAGYCSATHCEEQKRKEQKIIEEVINSRPVARDIIDSKQIKNMVESISENRSVDFERLAKKVKKQTIQALKRKNFAKGTKGMADSLTEILEYK